jgi:hypothetical protein
MRRFAFPRPWPARTVGNRTLPVTLAPVDDAGVRGPLRDASGWETSVPGSFAIIDRDGASPGRAFLGRTADSLDSGPAPDRINRGTTARNAGVIGPTDIAGWPYDGNALLVPHTVIPRTPITVTPFARTIDTGVTIPSIPIGGPL